MLYSVDIGHRVQVFLLKQIIWIEIVRACERCQQQVVIFYVNIFFRIRHGRFTPTKFGQFSPLANCKGFTDYFLANNPIPVKSRIPVKI